MPRLPHSILLKAYKKTPFLPLVLRGSRTLPSAINELRWLTEHVQETSPRKSPKVQHQKLLRLCKRRSKGEPLQYILGTQPFGELEIKCRSGALIPRPETEAYTTYLAQLINSKRLTRVLTKKFVLGDDPFQFPSVKPRYPSYLKILDLCTGSGCISLLLNSVLSKYSGHVQIHGWDISRDAIALAKENWAHNIQLGYVKESADKRVRFEVVDIFDDGDKLQEILLKQSHRNLRKADVNIIIANPPYISQEAFETETTRSVRNWEPKLALVPEKRPISDVFEHPPSKVLKVAETTHTADIFYQRLLVLHSDVFKSQVLLMEIGDDAQALRVAKTALAYCHSRTTKKRNHVEIWRDSPDTGEYEELQIGEHMVPVRGSGTNRAVVLLKYRRSTPAGQTSKLRPAALKTRKTKLGHT